MKTSFGHLSYCTNVHKGESWKEHFLEIKKSVPPVKDKVSPQSPFGIGLRLSNIACNELLQPEIMLQFKNWLSQNDCYVFSLNGFPYGSFHSGSVKSKVYAPDWTMRDRMVYTLKLFQVLKELLPEGIEGSISTSPLSYRYWFKNKKMVIRAYEKSAQNILEVIGYLAQIYEETGKILHLNIEPEPDGLLESTFEFIEWYNKYYIPLGYEFLKNKDIKHDKDEILKRHLRLCYDICHSAVAYEETEKVIQALRQNNILIGKVQVSSALHINLSENRNLKIEKLKLFDESVYLHQVVAVDENGILYKFRDIPEVLEPLKNNKFKECRVHFHVPVFYENYGELSSTRDSIIKILKEKISDHWEVETYTWKLLPPELQLPINESIARELAWVKDEMNKNASVHE